MSSEKAFDYLFKEYREWWNNVRTMSRVPADEWKEITEKLITFTFKNVTKKMEQDEVSVPNTLNKIL